MIKPIYGLKDAPRAWRKKLHQVLIGQLSCRQLYAEPELYCAHGKKLGAVPAATGKPERPERSALAAGEQPDGDIVIGRVAVHRRHSGSILRDEQNVRGEWHLTKERGGDVDGQRV